MKIIATFLALLCAFSLSGCITHSTSLKKITTYQFRKSKPLELWKRGDRETAVLLVTQLYTTKGNYSESVPAGEKQYDYLLCTHSYWEQKTLADPKLIERELSGKNWAEEYDSPYLKKGALEFCKELPSGYHKIFESNAISDRYSEGKTIESHYAAPWAVIFTIPADIVTAPVQIIGAVIFGYFVSHSGC